MNPKLEKWLKWLKVIHDDIQDLVIAKREFNEVQALIKENPKLHKPSSFYGYLARTYVSHVLMGVRRQIKYDTQSISLMRLMKEMIDSPETITRKYYVDLYHDSVVQNFADKDFEKFADAGALYIKASLVCDDLAKIRKASERCEEYADKRVAHWDKREPKNLPTFGELDTCVDILDQVYTKYHLLFHAANMDSLLPVRQFDSKAIFREPWISPK